MASAGSFELVLQLWRRRRALVVLLQAAAIAAGIGIAALWLAAPEQSIAAGLAGGLLAAAAIWAARRLRSQPRDRLLLARHLDRVAPELEESAELLAYSATTPLAELQRRRMDLVLSGSVGHGSLPAWPWARLAVLLGAALLATWGLSYLTGWRQRGVAGAQALPVATAVPTARALAPKLVTLTIVAPAYTGRAAREGSALDGEVEEGALVRWRVAAPAAQSAALLFDDGELPFTAAGSGDWHLERRIERTQVYALVLRAPGAAEYRSPYARLAVIPDRPPAVRIVAPQTALAISAAAVGSMRVEVSASDDYGLSGVELVGTIARGAGEQVEFLVQRWPLTSRGIPTPGVETPGVATPGGSEFSRTLDLRELGLVAGSELTLQAEAQDRRTPRPNMGTSEVVRIRVAGGASESVGLDRGLPQIRIEASLRSQRQIIADTERLLAERRRLSPGEFEQRSESLGFDQRALRLRYGGLLGEEVESGTPGGEEESGHDEQPASPASAALAALPEGFVHRHDSQDVATYFDDPERARMKAALAEMWGAEGQLRLGDPATALPFELRALRLLKSAQEQSRVYVAKLGSELPQVDLGKRLSGDLAGIDDRRVHGSGTVAAPQPAQAALAAIAEIRAGTSSSDTALATLRAAQPELARAAAAVGGPALAALDALAAIGVSLEQRQSPGVDALAALETGLVSLLPVPVPAPVARPAGGQLEREYRRALAIQAAEIPLPAERPR
jgi:hypothetical protein